MCTTRQCQMVDCHKKQRDVVPQKCSFGQIFKATFLSGQLSAADQVCFPAHTGSSGLSGSAEMQMHPTSHQEPGHHRTIWLSQAKNTPHRGLTHDESSHVQRLFCGWTGICYFGVLIYTALRPIQVFRCIPQQQQEVTGTYTSRMQSADDLFLHITFTCSFYSSCVMPSVDFGWGVVPCHRPVFQSRVSGTDQIIADHSSVLKKDISKLVLSTVSNLQKACSLRLLKLAPISEYIFL